MSCSDDQLPDLSVLLGLPKSTAVQTESCNLRRSPRKNMSGNAGTGRNDAADVENLTVRSSRIRRSPSKRSSPTKSTKSITTRAEAYASGLGAIPILPRKVPFGPVSASSNNRSSPRNEPKPVGLIHVDSLLLPTSKNPDPDPTHDRGRKPTKRIAKKEAGPRGSRFVLSEARCNDDEEESVPEEDEDEETDLSGFIVDDDVDLSYNEWSEDDAVSSSRKVKILPRAKPSRRLQRGSPPRPRLENKSHKGHEDGEHSDGDFLFRLRSINLDSDREHKRKASKEVIDLTQSPVEGSENERESGSFRQVSEHRLTASPKPNALQHFDHALKLPPPRFDLLDNVPQKQGHSDSSLSLNDVGAALDQDRFTTPPATPPRSPSKLKSPSKLLSPSKRDIVHRSPHRQSTDAFWDLHTINSWNDQYSPKKAPVASPGKRGLARFQIWSDDSANEDLNNTSSSSLPSPCSSPTKSRSPLKSPEKEERQRTAAQKKAAKERKAAFDSAREQLALDLFNELDKHITSSKLSSLSKSTGGVEIVWSKTLRSTAGRANWRRTVIKPTASPVKGNTVPSGPGVKVEHFANIELAAKVIDSEDRLVNTLAHEFCHLANFMVSNIRDQPHGASFKAWAKKVTDHLQKSDSELWRKVEVTTKHSYKIDHKYLWLCVGRERSKAAEFLNLQEDEGCGAEYGRHSKSIDTEKQRCGRCKGKLVQVRPKPRQSPVKKTAVQKKGKSGIEAVEKMMEVLELSD